MAEDAQDALDLPPEPVCRTITPAPEDYADPPPLESNLWPLMWFAILAVLIAAVVGIGWYTYV